MDDGEREEYGTDTSRQHGGCAANSETYYIGPSRPQRPARAHYFGCQPRPYYDRLYLALFLSADTHALNCVGAAAANFGYDDTRGDANNGARHDVAQ